MNSNRSCGISKLRLLGGMPTDVQAWRERLLSSGRHYFAERPFTTLEDFNCQARQWRDEIAHQGRWPEDDSRTVQGGLS